ncbi:MAG TPA: FmdE family protein [Chitinivibrionales bacterium]|jgi:formylmethanofuran dehydrogenase subunit E|nr:FmdE family protein [Chitinivibrionales bacterium]
MKDPKLEELLDKCIAYHGHLCMGQVLGVRLAVKGLSLAAPSTYKDLIVVVENDRCIADAIQTVTGTRLGRRSFKLKDYGRMAATFMNVTTNHSWRLNIAMERTINNEDENAVRQALYIPDEEMLAWREVRVNLRPEEMPGKPKRVVTCVVCGERVFDGKDTIGKKGPVCMACSLGSYYTVN